MPVQWSSFSRHRPFTDPLTDVALRPPARPLRWLIPTQKNSTSDLYTECAEVKFSIKCTAKRTDLQTRPRKFCNQISLWCISRAVCSPYSTLNLRRPSFSSRCRSDLEQSSAARHIRAVTFRLLPSPEDILNKSKLKWRDKESWYTWTAATLSTKTETPLLKIYGKYKSSSFLNVV